jgi:hypothetical protein
MTGWGDARSSESPSLDCGARNGLEFAGASELATLCLGIRCIANAPRREAIERLERGTGFEPATSCLEGTE